MGRALVVGAGAIGRGFIPWCLPSDWSLLFADTSVDLVDGISRAGSFQSWMTFDDGVRPLRVANAEFSSVDGLAGIDLSAIDVCFIAVGPRNVERLPLTLRRLTCPIYSLENDPETVQRIARLLESDHVRFGIPDVITSSTASPDHLVDDPWSLHTEAGTLYLQGQPALSDLVDQGLDVVWCDEAELARQWEAKLYLHNAPHAIAAYLGSAAGYHYLHEAMADHRISHQVRAALSEILAALSASPDRAESSVRFLGGYADKELRRFRNPLLFDPITRVARQPLRKLRRLPHGRLTGVVEMCLAGGVVPTAVTSGVVAALRYDNPTDDDHGSLQLLPAYGIEQFLWHFLGVEPGSVTSRFICRAFEDEARP